MTGESIAAAGGNGSRPLSVPNEFSGKHNAAVGRQQPVTSCATSSHVQQNARTVCFRSTADRDRSAIGQLRTVRGSGFDD